MGICFCGERWGTNKLILRFFEKSKKPILKFWGEEKKAQSQIAKHSKNNEKSGQFTLSDIKTS